MTVKEGDKPLLVTVLQKINFLGEIMPQLHQCKFSLVKLIQHVALVHAH